MFKKRLFEKKNELRRRAYSIIISDRNNDEKKRRNQKIYEMNTAFNDLHKSILDFGYSCENVINIFSKSINNITRG